ncbi:DUF3383 family protein [Bradyrhizobium sp.]
MSTIPASLYVAVTPSVLPAGGEQLDVITLVGSASNRVPIGAVYSFATGPSVTSFFGSGSAEDIVANGGAGKGSGYFGGFTGADVIPGAILFAQYNQAAVSAYIWGGNAGAALTLAQLQALSGSLTVVMDGYSHVISSISLASYNSFSAAAAGIQAAFTDPTEASFTASIGANFTGSQSGINLTTTSVTGIISVGDVIAGTGVTAGTTIISQTSGPAGGAGVYVTSVSGTASSASCTASSTVLDITVDTDHTIAVGQTVTGSGVAAGTIITAQLTGTAGQSGTYRISGAAQLVASEAMTGVATAPVVTFDSLSGAFIITSGITGVPSTAAFATGTLAAPLLLTQATGAFLSQGAAGQTPAQFMNGVVAVTTNFVCYKTSFDPDGGSGNTLKQAFAAWKNAYPNRYAYVVGDTDVLAVANPPQTETLGYILANNGDSGTFLITENAGTNVGSFVCGAAASIDFEETNGRITFAYKNQPGLVASVVTATQAVNAGGNPQVNGSFGNGYNYFGAVGAANQNFLWLQRGTVTGPFKWFDSYINQIWWNNLLQNTLLNFLGNIKSVPFNQAGAGLIEQALASPIQAGLNFGAAAPGTISSTQIAEVNTAAGANIAGTLQTQGYYLQVLQQSATVRGNRGPWAITLWYLDRGSCQSISLSSIAVE